MNRVCSFILIFFSYFLSFLLPLSFSLPPLPLSLFLLFFSSLPSFLYLPFFIHLFFPSVFLFSFFLSLRPSYVCHLTNCLSLSILTSFLCPRRLAETSSSSPSSSIISRVPSIGGIMGCNVQPSLFDDTGWISFFFCGSCVMQW